MAASPDSSDPAHWNAAYDLGETTRGWYQRRAEVTLDLLRRCGISPHASVVDVGGGASILVDDLLDAGFSDISVVDHSPVALDIARRRVGSRADGIDWILADIRYWRPTRRYDLWHDRAVLHFLLSEEDRSHYAETLRSATHSGSRIVIGVFGPDGPSMCAGLPVRRSTVEDLQDLLSDIVSLESSELRDHIRPDGDIQQYLWVTGTVI